MKINQEIEKLQTQVKTTDDVVEKAKLLKRIKKLKEKSCIAKH